MATVKSEPKNVTPLNASLTSTPVTLPGNLGTLAVSAPMSFADFEKPETGEVIGGNYVPIKLEQSTVSPLLKFVKETKLTLPTVELVNGVETKVTKLIKVPVAEIVQTGVLTGMPIGAIFKKHWESANVQAGDTFVIGRYPDVIKKSGLGGGSSKMQVYAIKIISRAQPVIKELTQATA